MTNDEDTRELADDDEEDIRPIARLLYRAADDDKLLRRFLETVGLRLVVKLATVPALGGSGSWAGLALPCPLPSATLLTSTDIRRLAVGHPDQSLAAHLLNGLFAGRRVGLRLTDDQALTEDEWRIWLLGFTSHDYNKAWGIRAEPARLDLGREAIRQLGEILGFHEFWPEWLSSLDDVLFVAQNAEKVSGSNLNLRDYGFARLFDHRRRERLRQLASFADLLVHARSPSDVALRTSDGRPLSENLRETLRGVFGSGRAPRLAYHKLADVRGLLSNLIHNAVAEAVETAGYEAFLFFPNGVVYLAPSERPAEVDPATLAAKAWEAVVQQIADSGSFGVTRGATGMRASSALGEIVGWQGILNVARRASLRIGPRQARAKTRLHGYLTGQSDNDLKRLYPDEDERKRVVTESVAPLAAPSDQRVDQLAEFLIFLFRSLLESGLGEGEATGLLLRTLAIDGTVSPAEALREKGGTRYGWYYAAARFLQSHPGLDEGQLAAALEQLGTAALPLLEGKGRRPRSGRASLSATFTEYVVQHLEIDGRRVGQDTTHDFAAELQRYVETKAANRPLCTLCAARYDAVEEEATEVPFGPQAYSNRRRLDSRKVIRGICPICRVEYILRRVAQERVREDSLPIQIFLYPTYFFTRETERLVQSFVHQLADLNIWKLRNHLAGRGFAPAAVADFPGFLLATGGPRTLFVHPPAYDTRHGSGLVFFSMTPGGQKPTDTDSWILPALVALCAPYLLNVKAVVSASYVPAFESGSDFRETVVLDGAPVFLTRTLGGDRFHLDAIPSALRRLLNLYDLHVDVFAEPTDPHWPLISGIARDVTSDPYAVFSYYDRRKRKPAKGDGRQNASSTGLPSWDVDRYMRIFSEMRGDKDMTVVEELVRAYAKFYQPWGYSAYELIRPLSIAIDVTTEATDENDPELLQQLVAGAVDDFMERVRNHQVKGTNPILSDGSVGDFANRMQASRSAVADFARVFVKRAFSDYCQADRAVLREQANRLRSAARFVYLAEFRSATREQDSEGKDERSVESSR